MLIQSRQHTSLATESHIGVNQQIIASIKVPSWKHVYSDRTPCAVAGWVLPEQRSCAEIQTVIEEVPVTRGVVGRRRIVVRGEGSAAYTIREWRGTTRDCTEKTTHEHSRQHGKKLVSIVHRNHEMHQHPPPKNLLSRGAGPRLSRFSMDSTFVHFRHFDEVLW